MRLLSLILLLFFAARSAAKLCDTCNTDPDCASCTVSPDIPHSVFSGDLQVKYTCVTGHCQLNVATVKPSLAIQCGLANSICCLPSSDSVADTAACQKKKCKTATGCDKRAFCTYDDNTDVYEGCCSVPSDCPAASNIASPTALQTACQTPTCTATNCTYVVPSGCCAVAADCPVVAAPRSQTCVQNPNVPDKKYCVSVLNAASTCSINGQCGGVQSCFTGTCESGTCKTVAKNPLNPASGCCASPSNLAPCQSTTCRAATGCVDDLVFHPVESINELPNFSCIYDNKETRGCCVSDPQCITLSQRSNCISSDCNTEENRCRVATGKSTPCCYSSDMCGIAQASNMCKFYTCTGPPSLTVVSADAFKCVQNTVPSCDPLNAPVAGLVPGVVQSVATQFDCTWTCVDSDFNTIDSAFTFLNPVAANRPVYGFDFSLSITNTANKDVVLSTILVTQPTSSNGERLVATNAFVASAPITTPAGTYIITFVSQDYFYVAPGEAITFKVRTVFAGDAAVSGLVFKATFNPYEPCTAYYVGQTGCIASDTFLVPKKRIQRTPFFYPSVTAGFSGAVGDKCSQQCFNAIPTPPPAPGATTTPAPPTTTGAAPTPPPVSLPISGSNGPDRSVKLEVVDCKYACTADDTTPNRYKFRFTETNTSPVDITTAIKYEFTLNLLPDSFDSISPPGTVFDYFVNEPVPADLATGPSVIAGSKITFTPSPVIVQSGNSQAFNFSYFRSINSIGQIVTGGSLVWKAYLSPFLCNQFQVIRGLCTEAQLGLTIAPTLSDTLQLEFGSEADKCTTVACPVVPFIPYAKSSRYNDIDCAWDCSADSSVVERSRYSVERCLRNNNAPGSGNFYLANFFVTVSSENPDAFLGPGSLYDVKGVVPGFDPIIAEFSDLANAWSVDIPGSIPYAPGEEICFGFQFYRNPFFSKPGPITLGYQIFDLGQCTIPDLEIGQCVASSPRIAANSGVSVVATLDANFGALTLNGCDESCDAGTILDGTVGGRVFFDQNGDGSLNGNEPFFSGIQVEVVRSTALTIVASTTSDINGYFYFDETAIFASATFVFFRLVPSTIPAGLQVTVLGNQNPFWNNEFFGSPPRSGNFYKFGTAALRLAGLRANPPCQRNFTGPFDPVGKSRIAALATTCTTCLTGPSLPALSCTPAKCSGAAIHRILVVDYGLSNTDNVALVASTVRVEFQQALANLDDSQLLCADMRSETIDANMFANSDAAAVLSGSNARPAHADISWSTWPVGSNSLKFSVRIAFCASNTNFRYNITATIKSKTCGTLIQGWSSCATGKADDDFRACFNELSPTLLPACPATCAPTPAPTPIPGAPTPAPTFGPPGQSTPVNTEITKFEEDDQCVTNAFIRTQPCGDINNAISNCTAAAVRNIVFFRYELSLKPLAIVGESGTAIITLQRNMPRSTQFCQRFNPEIRLTIVRNNIVVNNTAAIVTSSIVDQNLQRVKLKLGFLKFNASTVIYLDVRVVECIQAPTPFNYTGSIQIVSAGCHDTAACTKTKQFTNNAPDIPCEAAVAEPAFADPNGGGTHITEQFEAFEGEGSTNDDTGITALILSILLGVILCCVCCLFCVPIFLRRMRSTDDKRKNDATTAPAKRVEFDPVRGRAPTSTRGSRRVLKTK